MTEDFEIRHFNIREADWATEGNVLSNIRRLVFIVEQKVPPEEEWDGHDEDSWHWLATDAKDFAIGTARLLPDGQIGRIAVLTEQRKHGIGAALLERAVDKARHLGMKSVFLNAQTHALGFYEHCGFTAQGDEFMEAGIPHLRMTQELSPPEDNVQRTHLLENELNVVVKPFDTSEVGWAEASKNIIRVRRQVFVTSLGLPEILAQDDTDNECLHWVAENADGHVVGTIRMSRDGAIARLAVMEDYRHLGIGYSLVELGIQRARRYGLNSVRLAALSGVVPFYERAGFVKIGDSYDEAGRQHQAMEFDLTDEDDELEHQDPLGESLAGDVAYRLGEDKQLILLRSEEDFKNVIVEMTRQGTQSIRIYSPLLSHDLFDRTELMDICSRLARRNKYTKVEILIFDPHRVIKNGHVLLNIARKLPTSIGIKIVDPEMRQQNHEYVLVDGQGVIYRQEYTVYEGRAYFLNITETNRLDRQFTASWESGLLDANLRQLRI